MNIAKKETPKDKLVFGIPTSMKLIFMVVYDIGKYNTHYTSIVIKIWHLSIIRILYSTFEYKLLENK